jgi:hypothetical protein
MTANYRPPYTPLYLTPDSVPVGRFCRVIVIPDDPTWVGLVDGILSALSNPLAWRKYGTLTPEEAADAWMAMLTESWETDNVPCCPEFSLDPSTGLPQYSNDGGLTWYRFPDGPYNDDTAPYAPPPPALGKGNAQADKCQAAANAAAVLAQFYKETFGAFTASILNTVLSINGFLYQVNQTLLRLIYPDAVQLGLALEWDEFDFTTQFTAAELTEEQVADMTCVLLDAAIWTSGIVTFDFAAAEDGMDDVLGENPGTAVQLLMEYIGSVGLNSAGGVNSVADPDCNCGWCYTFDFTESDGGWTAIDDQGTWDTDGWHSALKTFTSPVSAYQTLYMKRTFASTVITKVSASYGREVGDCNESGDYSTAWFPDGVEPALDPHYFVCDFPASPLEWTGSQEMTSINLLLLAGRHDLPTNPGGYSICTSITFHGEGENPFGDSNC